MPAKKPAAPPNAKDEATELEELKRLRGTLWRHLDGIEPGGQTLGIGAIAGQLQKCNTRIAELEDDSDEEISIADQLAAAREARERRGDGPARPVRRGSK